jgi:tetratricopeptide (TPR) repeat protein
MAFPIHRPFLLFLVMSMPFLAIAQDRVSEDEINIQKVFIDANRERLMGNYEKALGLYKAVLKEDRENDAATYEIARIHEAQEEMDKAISSIKKAIQMAPDNEWYGKYAADLYQKTGQDDLAADIYQDLTQRNPNDEYYYYKWAYFLVRANAIDDALNVYDRLEQQFGLGEELVRRKHSLYLGIGKPKEAARELQRLIDAFPEITDYRHLLATFYQQIGEDKKAVAVYKDILQIDPSDQKAQIGALAEERGGEREELQYLRSLAPAFRENTLAIDLKIEKIIPFIRKVADTEDPVLADAVLELTQILETVHPDDAKGFSASGDLLYYSGRRTEAIARYRQTLERDENVFAVWEQLLYALSEEKDFNGLKDAAEETMDIYPNKAIAYYFYGMATHKLAEYEEAQEILETGLMMAVGNGRLQYDIQKQLGQTYFELDAFRDSDQAFDAALKLNPKSPEVLSAYSYRLALRGERLGEAQQMAEKATDMVTNKSSYQHALGWVYYKQKDFDKAAKWLQKAVETNIDNDPDTFEHYGDVLYQLGDIEQAVNFWTQAQTNGSSSSVIEKKIADRKLYE